MHIMLITYILLRQIFIVCKHYAAMGLTKRSRMTSANGFVSDFDGDESCHFS
jgi:hypothetical protein